MIRPRSAGSGADRRPDPAPRISTKFRIDPRAGGCNQLLREGATLVESAADVLAVLAGAARPPVASPSPRLAPPPTEAGDAERARIEELLGAEPILADDVVRQSALSTAVVNGVLLELELAGRVERHPGNRFARLYKSPANPL